MVAFFLDASTPPSLGEVAKLGNIGSVEIEAVVQGPSAQETPLRIDARESPLTLVVG